MCHSCLLAAILSCICAAHLIFAARYVLRALSFLGFAAQEVLRATCYVLRRGRGCAGVAGGTCGAKEHRRSYTMTRKEK